MSEELRLNLAHQDLSFVPSALIRDYGDMIKIIDVSNNKIKDVSFLEHFTKLNSVIIDHNELSAEVVFPYLPSVTTLWLNFNEITFLYPFIENIKKSFPRLRHLSLMGNPIVPPCTEDTYYEYIQYRLYILSWLPDLQYLDDRRVSDDERAESFRLFRRPEFSTSERFTNAFQSAIGRFRQFLTASPIMGERYPRETSSVI